MPTGTIASRGTWLERDEWPLPETRWGPFNLHPGGLLSEHEFLPGSGCSTFEDTCNARGSLTFTTPALVEATTLAGPTIP